MALRWPCEKFTMVTDTAYNPRSVLPVKSVSLSAPAEGEESSPEQN